MPRKRLHGVYQDHICSCILRVARETFALLPVDTVLITASVETTKSSAGRRADQPVLSVALSRERQLELDFENLDPSDAVETFPHRGDFKASRTTAAFAPIVPLTPADLTPEVPKSADSADLLLEARALRETLTAELTSLSPPKGSSPAR